MYAHSNELEEVGVVSLTGTNVESDPQKEMLLGVSTMPSAKCHRLIRFTRAETFFFHTLYCLELSRTCGSQRQGTPILDNETGSHSFTIIMTICDLLYSTAIFRFQGFTYIGYLNSVYAHWISA